MPHCHRCLWWLNDYWMKLCMHMFGFVHKIFQLLMCKWCVISFTHPHTTHKHLKYQKHSPTKLFDNLLTTTHCTLAKHLDKSLMFYDKVSSFKWEKFMYIFLKSMMSTTSYSRSITKTTKVRVAKTIGEMYCNWLEVKIVFKFKMI